MKNNNQSARKTKRECAIDFLDVLIKCESFKPFLYMNDMQFGMFDFQYIAKKQMLSLLKLREEVQSKKYFNLQVFVNQAKRVFAKVSDYLLLDDPLQETCHLGLQMVAQFQGQHKNVSKRKGKIEDESKKEKQTNINSQLQMIYYLKRYENDEQLVRQIGQVCNIITEDENQFVFDLGSNNIWLPLVKKTDYQ